MDLLGCYIPVKEDKALLASVWRTAISHEVTPVAFQQKVKQKPYLSIFY